MTVMTVAMMVTRAALAEMNLIVKVPHMSFQFVASNSNEVDAVLSLFY